MKYRIIKKPNGKYYIQKKYRLGWLTIIIHDKKNNTLDRSHENHYIAKNSLLRMLEEKEKINTGIEVVEEYDFTGGELSVLSSNGGELSKESI